MVFELDWTGKTWTSKTRTGKTRTGKGRTGKTRTGKTSPRFTKLPYISVCNTNLPQGLSGTKICEKKTIANKDLNKNT